MSDWLTNVPTGEPVRLYLGSGKVKRSGWVSIDVDSKYEPHILYDLTMTPWPLECDSVELIYAEMFFSQLDPVEGESAARESWKALKPGGTLRVHEVNFHDIYAGWITGRAAQEFAEQTFAEQHSSWFKRYGWKLIYDRETMALKLYRAGFREVVERVQGRSDIPEFVGIEQHGVGGFVMEATK